jgi:hypothetical protein
LDRDADGYSDLVDSARSADADAFVATVEDVAAAARAVGEGNRDALQGRKRTNAEVLTLALRFDLADVQLRLACAEHGITAIGS